MTLFRNDTHRDLWKQRWCHTCFEPHEAARRIQGRDAVCPIWEKALRTGRKPVEWDRTRSDEMEKSIKCNAYTNRPMRSMKPEQQFEDVPMFDVEPRQAHLVPIEGWPDRPTKNEVEHQ